MLPSWRSERHAAQWVRSLQVDAAAIRKMPVDKVSTEDVLSVLKPLWSTRRETASRLRSRIERVLDAAKAKGLRSGENVARWKGHLEQLLPGRQRIERKHLAAMLYSDVPAFMAMLKDSRSIAAMALEFTILTAARTNEVRLAQRGEIDLDVALWTIPAKRMKGGREHVVPLSPRAVDILREVMKIPDNQHLFAGRKPGKPLAKTAMERVLIRMKVTEATVHGFRSSLRDWCGDCTPFARDVVEAALAHAIGNKVEAAYRRSTALSKRAELMRAWERFCCTPPAENVVLFRGAS